MDRQAFKQRMQNLKSYRENNPGKGYWDWKVEAFAEGGQTGDPEKERFYQATGRSSSGRPLEEGLKPVFSLEDAAKMLLKIHTKPSVLYKDFLARPLVNKINKNKNQEIV